MYIPVAIVILIETLYTYAYILTRHLYSFASYVLVIQVFGIGSQRIKILSKIKAQYISAEL